MLYNFIEHCHIVQITFRCQEKLFLKIKRRFEKKKFQLKTVIIIKSNFHKSPFETRFQYFFQICMIIFQQTDKQCPKKHIFQRVSNIPFFAMALITQTWCTLSKFYKRP
uniref:(northern house mosquito) hypothetical protein n=1 Tax=Culex pipiens TaxID=7175 RepID=A0A8D8AW93_CULPI